MRLTTKGRYAVTAMLDLTIHGEGRAVALSEIAVRQGISQAYLEQLFARLRRAGLVNSTRGPGGGYRLTRPPRDIAVAEVIRAVDEDIDATRCGGARNCHEDGRCLTHDLWSELSDRIANFLGGISLGELSERASVREVARRQLARVAGEEPVRFVDVTGV